MWQFTSSRHRQNLHSGRRILQSDGVHIGTDQGHMRIRVSGPIPGTNSGSESSPNVELDLARLSRPILYWKSVMRLPSSYSQHHSSMTYIGVSGDAPLQLDCMHIGTYGPQVDGTF